MELLNEEEIVSIEIDLEELKKNKLNESFLAMFGTAIKMILGRMFDSTPGWAKTSQFSILGKRSDVESFAKTIGREKRYLDSAKKHGLNHKKTYADKKKLEKAILSFKKDTGLTWPFK